MKLIRLTVQTAKKRPVIIVLPTILILLFTVVNSYNPVLPILMGLSSVTGSSIFDGIVSAIQLALEPNILPIVILAVAGFIIFGSLLAGILYSGYLYILNNTLAGIAKAEGDFTMGMRKYFKNVFLVTLRVLLVTVFFICFIMVACVPAIVVTRAAATTRPEMLLAGIAVDVLTVGVLFFSLMFTRAYLFYWYPALFKVDKNAFREAKRFADKQFWQIVVRFLLFDVIFVLFQYIIFVIGAIGLKLLLNWVFCTAFFTIFTVFIVSSYRDYSGKA